MSTTPTTWTPPIDEEKIPPEIALHLRLIYDRLQNHANAIASVNAKVTPVTK